MHELIKVKMMVDGHYGYILVDQSRPCFSKVAVFWSLNFKVTVYLPKQHRFATSGWLEYFYFSNGRLIVRTEIN